MHGKINPKIPRKTRHPEYGPAMSACSPLQRRFVETLFEFPQLTQAAALTVAGYKGENPNTVKKTAQRMMHNSLVLEAIKELAELNYRGKLPKVVGRLDDIIADPKHRDHVKVLHGVLDRVGMHPVAETKVTHTFDRNDIIARIAALLEKNNLTALPEPTRIAPPAIDAEFDEARDE